MSKAGPYLLDANVFIEAANRYYAFDLVPTFWTELISKNSTGSIGSIDRIRAEIENGNNALATWVVQQFAQGFSSSNTTIVVTEYSRIINWAQNNPQFTQIAKAEFAAVADGWLVAYALAHKHTVVTHEILAPNIQNRIKIPNVCVAFNVPYCNTFEMLRALGIRLS